jgi:signal transduction histidine kinase
VGIRGRLSARSLTTVRARTTLVATLVVGIALAAGAAVLLLTLRASLLRSGDSSALARARDLAGLASANALPSTVTAPGEDDVVQVVDSNGRVMSSSANIEGVEPIAALHPTTSTPAAVTVRGVANDGEPESYRVWAVRADTEQGPLFVYVGTSLEQVSEATATLVASLAVGLPVLLALVAFVTWLLLGRALQPVEDIRSQVSEISAKALDRRVPVPRSDDEISRLAETMNAMLDRLESASRRQREFVADASHELLSPLASFRAQLDVAQAHPKSTDWSAMAADLSADSNRMERIVADLLYLARTDSVPVDPATDLVDLDDIVLEEARRVRSHSRVRVDTSRVSAAPVRGNREELRRMIRNLLDNAVRYARESVVVELTATDHVLLSVHDDGPGVPPEQSERIFKRFVRLDTARSLGSAGTGLGLSIVQAIAARHQGEARLDPSAAGARLVVRLPAPAR